LPSPVGGWVAWSYTEPGQPPDGVEVVVAVGMAAVVVEVAVVGVSIIW